MSSKPGCARWASTSPPASSSSSSQNGIVTRAAASTLAELTSVLHGTATITDLRAHLAKSGTRLTEFFKMLDDGDGLLTCDEFRAAMRKTGFTSVDAIGIDHLFRQLDRDGSGEITFRELRTALEQSVKAEQATNARVRMMRHETPVKVVDLGDVRYEVQRRLRVMAAEVDLKAANLAQHGGKDVAPKGAKDRWRWAKERKAAQDGKRRAVFEKESVHMRLRLRGTELEPGQRDDGGFASELHTAPNSPSRAVTRHGRLPSVNLRNLDGDRWNSQTSKLAILAAHRRRSHAPAQRHCRVLLPPDPSRGKRQLHKSQSQYGSTSPKLPAISPTRTSAGSNCSSSDDKTSPPSNTPSFQSRSRGQRLARLRVHNVRGRCRSCIVGPNCGDLVCSSPPVQVACRNRALEAPCYCDAPSSLQGTFGARHVVVCLQCVHRSVLSVLSPECGVSESCALTVTESGMALEAPRQLRPSSICQ